MVTVVTKTIGPTGRDYTTFTLAEAAVESIATAEFGSTDLVANDGAIVFEADAGTYDGLLFAWTLTTDATRNVTFKPATGSEHGGVFGAGVILQDNTAVTSYIALMVNASTNHCVFDGLAFNVRSGASSTCTSVRSGVGHIWRDCLFSSEGPQPLNKSEDGFSSGSAAAPIVFENCVTKGEQGYVFNSNKTGSSMRFVNCTHLASDRMFDFYTYAASSQAAEIVNCVTLGGGDCLTDSGPTATTITGSNNFGGATNPFPAALQGSPYPITATTSFSTPLGSGDYAVYMGSNGSLANVTGNDVWQQGVGPGSNASVPTTDINGVARSGASCNPGAFEADGFVAPTVTTQTIGPVGRDFATFTLAEASLPSEDITFTNQAFVFEADAGTYSENVIFSSSLVTDATRQVTYKPAAGSEHGGQWRNGAVIEATSTAALCSDDYLQLTGLSIYTTGAHCVQMDAVGIDLNSLTLEGGVGIRATYLATDIQGIARNCTIKPGSHAVLWQNNVSGSVDLSVFNCTADSSGTGSTAYRVDSSTGGVTVEIVNCLSLGTGNSYLLSGSATVLGQNNFGAGTQPFPVALQGSPYPITASTAYDPGAGDFALYVGKNGALLDSPNNDVINGGVGPASNSDVPTTDILGDTRSGTTTNPGAFALAQATAVLTRTIGPVGRDYTTFTAAEADV